MREITTKVRQTCLGSCIVVNASRSSLHVLSAQCVTRDVRMRDVHCA